MIFVVAAVILPVVSAAVVLRLRECQVSLNDVLAVRLEDAASERAAFPVFEHHAVPEPEPSDVVFTRALLALSKVGPRVPDGSPAPASVESSSLVSIPRVQSKSRVLTP